MSGRLSFRYFAHSWISDWNHGNAHFLRGLASELVKQGHQVRCYEQRNNWSITNLAAEAESAVDDAFANFQSAFPELDVRFYECDSHWRGYLEAELKDADVVIVHEWNPPELASSILELRQKLGFRGLFHDTHHRAYTNPREIARYPVAEFDGILAFGEAIRRIYEEGFGAKRVWTLHEAADTAHFFPAVAKKDTDVAWIGNWGDEERTRELQEFLIAPAAELKECKFGVHGVRYPQDGLRRLAESGVEFRGYLPNLHAREMYARSRISLHVPRRFYADGLAGIPTIRVFEALAAGSPLICAPWSDTEGLFRPGEDFLCVPDTQAMVAELRHLFRDDKAREQIAASGLETIRGRHTCAHRALQLAEICHSLDSAVVSHHSSVQCHPRQTTGTSK
jgi:spore maturation protein CgeB